MLNKISQKPFFKFSEYLTVFITALLLPMDRFPFIHKIPFRLGFISLILLILVFVIRLLGADKKVIKNINTKRTLIASFSLLTLVILYFASSLWAIDGGHSLGVAKAFMLGSVRAFLLGGLLIINVDLRKKVEKSIYIITGLVVIYGFYQFLFDIFGASQFVTDLKNCCTSNSTYVFPRVHSFALEPLYLDHFLMIPLWLLTFKFYRSGKVLIKKSYEFLFIATATLFILTVARSAILGLILSALVFLLVVRNQKNIRLFFIKLFKLWSMAILLTAVLVGISGVASQFIEKDALYGADSGISSIGLFGSHAIDFNDGSSQTRYTLWPKIINLLEKEPLTGVGADNARLALNENQYKNGVAIKELQPFNNDLLGYLADFGFIGIIAILPFLYILATTLRQQLRSKFDHWASPFIFAFIGMYIQGNFFQSILLSRSFFVVGMILLLYVEGGKKIKAKKVA